MVDLLKRCLDSIPERGDIEVIVVDDISPASEIKKLKSLPVHKNVRIYESKEKGGAGHARNIGLSHASGKWLLFADADDYFAKGFDRIVDDYKDSDYNTVFFGFETRISETGELKSSRVIGSDRALRNKDVDFFKYRFHGPWAKLIRRDFVVKNNIKFEEVECSNDTFFSGYVGKAAKKAIVDEREIYVTTIRQGSLVHNMSIRSLTTRLDVSVRYNKFLKEIHKDKYRINLLSLIFYYRGIDNKLFREHLKVYLREERCFDIFIDTCKCVSGLTKQKFSSKKNLRKQIKIHN